ncbi:DUF4142 domain-containing protein [Chelativorans sp.]|uniref:DUF4142 domain-containing protein n=1 Tax=Chelativorans sp. TaxID=2203393 RepID=UPI00281289B7|nr:DUF4142 domain-containing protein [Chelativorans sp.]
MHRKSLLAAASLAVLLAGPAYAQDTNTNANTATPTEPQTSDQNDLPAGFEAATASTPQEFATMAAMTDLLEIESSRIALEKSQSEEVRQFAQHMIDDHTATSQALTQAAQADGVTNVPQALTGQHQQMVTQLQGLPAEQFDAAYIQMQVGAHQQAVALFQSYSQQEGALGDFAETTLPKLQEHLTHAQQLSQ